MNDAAKLESEIASDLASAIGPLLPLTREQTLSVVKALTEWLRPRVADVSDPRAVQLFSNIPEFVFSLRVELDERQGLRIVDPTGSTTGLLLERGARWMEGGDWRTVAVTCVSNETK